LARCQACVGISNNSFHNSIKFKHAPQGRQRFGVAVVYLDRVETAWPLRMNLSSGSQVPLHCTAGEMAATFAD